MSDPRQFATKLNEITEQYRNMVETEGKAVFNQAFTEVFEKHPARQEIAWNQYTPYFNDGDPCEFGVYDFQFKIDGISPDYGDEYDDDIYNWLSTYSRDLPADLKADIQAIQQIPDDVFQIIFGDHVQVHVTRDSIEVEEYYHD